MNCDRCKTPRKIAWYAKVDSGYVCITKLAKMFDGAPLVTLDGHAISIVPLPTPQKETSQ